MRISDWSSDVCSSDLFLIANRYQGRRLLRVGEPGFGDAPQRLGAPARGQAGLQPFAVDQPVGLGVASDDRRRPYGVVEPGQSSRFLVWPNLCLVFYLIQVEKTVGRAK